MLRPRQVVIAMTPSWPRRCEWRACHGLAFVPVCFLCVWKAFLCLDGLPIHGRTCAVFVYHYRVRFSMFGTPLGSLTSEMANWGFNGSVSSGNVRERRV